jgi:hypothetical protein
MVFMAMRSTSHPAVKKSCQKAALVEAFKAGLDCVIADIELCHPSLRNAVMETLRTELHHWMLSIIAYGISQTDVFGVLSLDVAIAQTRNEAKSKDLHGTTFYRSEGSSMMS